MVEDGRKKVALAKNSLGTKELSLKKEIEKIKK